MYTCTWYKSNFRNAMAVIPKLCHWTPFDNIIMIIMIIISTASAALKHLHTSKRHKYLFSRWYGTTTRSNLSASSATAWHTGMWHRFAASSLDALYDLSRSPTCRPLRQPIEIDVYGERPMVAIWLGNLAGDSMSRIVWESRACATLFPRYCAPMVTETGEIYSLCRGRGQHLVLVRVLHF